MWIPSRVTKADTLPRPNPCPMSPPGLDHVERSIRDWNLTRQLTSLPCGVEPPVVVTGVTVVDVKVAKMGDDGPEAM